MKFGQFSNSPTSYPIFTISIPDAPRSGAIYIFCGIVEYLVDEFENCPNVIDTFWQFFQKISGPSTLRPLINVGSLMMRRGALMLRRVIVS